MAKSKRRRKKPKQKSGKTKHHRKPKARGGKSDAQNISFISDKRHKAFHMLFGVSTPEDIARILNEDYIDLDRVMIAVPKKLWKKLMRQVVKRGGCSEIKHMVQIINRSTKL